VQGQKAISVKSLEQGVRAAGKAPAQLANAFKNRSMVLHHADNPAEILRNVVRFVPPGAPVVIGEFYPDGPCSQGPPHNHRLAPEKIREWCEKAGLAVVKYQRQSPEHYFVLTCRQS
jgi:hypothetical protein